MRNRMRGRYTVRWGGWGERRAGESGRMEWKRSQRDRKIKHRQVWRSGNVSHLIYYLSEQFPDAFMVSSSSIHEVNLVNYGPFNLPWSETSPGSCFTCFPATTHRVKWSARHLALLKPDGDPFIWIGRVVARRRLQHPSWTLNTHETRLFQNAR